VRYLHPFNTSMASHMTLTACSKWFLQELGHDGLNKMLAGFEDKSAQAVCTFAYCEGPGHKPIIFQGRTDVGVPLESMQIQELTMHRVKLFQREARPTLVSLIRLLCVVPWQIY
jgi:hypothetical protein